MARRVKAVAGLWGRQQWPSKAGQVMLWQAREAGSIWYARASEAAAGL